jgi:hypothetical protein
MAKRLDVPLRAMGFQKNINSSLNGEETVTQCARINEYLLRQLLKHPVQTRQRLFQYSRGHQNNAYVLLHHAAVPLGKITDDVILSYG